ncbi:hypothetical protein SADUNF_Sadunf17G0100500 [Salix dunnii]|uniref:Uncharacterized protein n=1 Tax=Salix dunnii TaxID=1413687 RepID=A0A835J7J5_9ROSI|nr:hypothetical protein SADUNF_Sadunf17G0100500 [Salix dunnii]
MSSTGMSSSPLQIPISHNFLGSPPPRSPDTSTSPIQDLLVHPNSLPLPPIIDSPSSAEHSSVPCIVTRSHGILDLASFPTIWPIIPRIIHSTYSIQLLFPLSLTLIHSPRLGFRAIGEISTHEDFMGKPSFVFLRNSDSTNGRCGGFCPREYVSVAEEVSSTDVENNVSSADEVRELLPEMMKEEEKEERFRGRRRLNANPGIGS